MASRISRLLFGEVCLVTGITVLTIGWVLGWGYNLQSYLSMASEQTNVYNVLTYHFAFHYILSQITAPSGIFRMYYLSYFSPHHPLQMLLAANVVGCKCCWLQRLVLQEFLSVLPASQRLPASTKAKGHPSLMRLSCLSSRRHHNSQLFSLFWY